MKAGSWTVLARLAAATEFEIQHNTLSLYSPLPSKQTFNTIQHLNVDHLQVQFKEDNNRHCTADDSISSFLVSEPCLVESLKDDSRQSVELERAP